MDGLFKDLLFDDEKFKRKWLKTPYLYCEEFGYEVIRADLDDLKEGMEIEHKKFGYGLIKSIDKTQNHQKAVVNFKLVGEKTLLLSFARLRIVK